MLLKNCTIISNKGELVVDILIEDRRIARIGHNIKHEGEALDIEEKYVLPGIIDPHVHLREPGMTHKEDFRTGSFAAAKGGVTTFIDMPNTIPPITSFEMLEKKRKLAAKSIVNYGFHFGAATDNIDEIKKVSNIASVKVFMNLSTGKLMIKDDKALKEIFSNSKLVTVHAEGRMVDKAIRLTKKCGNRLYLCHISQRSELDVIREEKTKDIYAEVTPHHLFLSDQDDNDGFTKMKPELKSPLDNEALFEAISEGLIDTVGTDHAPHTAGEKLSDEPPFGIPGLETMLPLMLDAVNNNRLELVHVQRLCCENPATIFGIKNKGFIKPGFDADLTVIDLKEARIVSEENLQTKCSWTPYEGFELRGWPVLTIVNGHIVYDGEIDDTVKGREVEFDE